MSLGLWMLWIAQSYGWYEGLGSCELRCLDSTNSLGLWMIWMILHHELKPLNAMNNSRLWMTWTTLGHEVKTVDTMINSGLWLTWITPGRELKSLNIMKAKGWDDISYLGSWAKGPQHYEQLKVVDDMNDSSSYELSLLNAMNISRLWMIWTIISWEPMALNTKNSSRMWNT